MSPPEDDPGLVTRSSLSATEPGAARALDPRTPFPAFLATRHDDRVERRLSSLTAADLGEGDVTVAVSWSSVNYKDALATIPGGQVARGSPLVPGVDLAGTVVTSSDPEIASGSEVLVHGYDLGAAHHGGFAAFARVPAGWVVPLPEGLDARQAMIVGTAGFTAALSVDQLERRGLQPGQGPVLVTGASGGVGSTAVGILAARGYEVVASTGKSDQHDWLRNHGAAEVIDRSELSGEGRRALDKERWAGAVDCVGGATLASVLRSLRYGAAVAASGLTGGGALATTVFPFILRGAALLGVDSVQVPIAERRAVWGRLASDLRPGDLDDLVAGEVGLDGLEPVLDDILAGRVRGRTLVRPTS
ncbi:MAG: oxidoreductase [Acidimicrobiales bacterium]